ncbi:lysophospholipid acyltransferase family protein [Roseovarius sp. Pro17]|uniref:lysophospholipid acyltransferase family protein n=1 Tax=Roseovarius sp. Pro17 TaxID=3108175 RepID=UPI002D765229|nr:lysophospholipid acyltransferase family protein [Roseovarius sp. Pro17]
MSAPSWPRADMAVLPPSGFLGWLRVVLRTVILLSVLAVLLCALLLVRAVERPLCGLGRPVSPYIVRAFFRACLIILNIRVTLRGEPMSLPGAVVANHASWLDIFVLNARHRVFFISKSEVAGWPVIGFLARAAGTLFIRREARDAQAQTAALEARLNAGHQLLFFPEGTSTDGLRVLTFKPTLFQAFFSPGLKETAYIQPVTVIYRAPEGQDAAFYGWFGDMDFGPHFLAILAAPRGGHAELVYHAPLKVADFDNRKTLAIEAEHIVRAAMPPERRG